jgi:hypothetical protein
MSVVGLRRLDHARSQLPEEVVERDLNAGGEAGGVGVLTWDGAQGGAGDGLDVCLGDVVRVEGVVVVTDDKGGDFYGPPIVDRGCGAGTWEGAQDDRILGCTWSGMDPVPVASIVWKTRLALPI